MGKTYHVLVTVSIKSFTETYKNFFFISGKPNMKDNMKIIKKNNANENHNKNDAKITMLLTSTFWNYIALTGLRLNIWISLKKKLKN